MRKTVKDAIVVGAALFAMFFGAGNLIFPPAIGMAAGEKWLLSLLGFLMTGIGLPVLGVMAVSKAGGTVSDLAGKVSKRFSLIIGTTIILAIGPLLAIPRTGATVYEIGIKPMLSVNPLVVSFIYFAITLAFVIKPNGIIDKVGKILTPILLGVIGLIIVVGVVHPIAKPTGVPTFQPIAYGFLEGYQTMDTLGAIVMGGIILAALIEKGYLDRKSQMKMTSIAGVIAGLGLAGVYGGLLYLGATASGAFEAGMSKTALIVSITNAVIGPSGQLIMCVAVSAACLTTSIGLTAIVGNYFESLTKGKLSYRVIVIATCVFSALMAAIGVESIVSIAVPLLVLVYPAAIVLIVFGLLDEFVKSPFIYKGAMVGALGISFFDAIKTIQLGFVQQLVSALEPVYKLISYLPFASYGFAWIMPTAVLAVAGGILAVLASKQTLMSAVSIED